MGKQGKERAKARREQRLQEISRLRKLPYSSVDRSGPLRSPHARHPWWSSETVAVVTGANRGIGYEIARQLAVHGLRVILTARDADRGRAAADGLRGEGLNLEFRQLDVSRADSVELFAKWIAEKYGGLDVLRVDDMTLREQLLKDDCLSEELIDEMVGNFLCQVKEGTWASNGWPQMYTDYSVSKLAVNLYTRLMARTLADRPEGHKIYINCYCPGWVKTAMTGWAGNASAEEGADTGIWVALLPCQLLTTGKFFAERREISF
ncbi:hypothetical protein BHE74_00009017 [Ensete ventricosum]|nr:hypothetical protein GW17_00019615 [Ensete ventricosum]RWW82518.1 hypothetical protein BHE74_00009017 [Ensete ventricosum]